MGTRQQFQTMEKLHRDVPQRRHLPERLEHLVGAVRHAAAPSTSEESPKLLPRRSQAVDFLMSSFRFDCFMMSNVVFS